MADKTPLERRIADGIMRDIPDRKGLSHVMETIEDDIIQETLDAWMDIIREEASRG